MEAVGSRSEKTVDVLIAHGANLNAETWSNGHSPLTLAARRGFGKIVDVLITHGADPSFQRWDGFTALLYATLQNYEIIVNSLIKGKCDVNAKIQRNGATALMLAALSGNDRVVNTLIKNGADANIKDHNKNILMDFCEKRYHREKFEALLNYSVRENFLLFLHGSGFAYSSIKAARQEEGRVSNILANTQKKMAMASRLDSVARCFGDHYWIRSLLELLHVVSRRENDLYYRFVLKIHYCYDMGVLDH